jgi:hypothetical protein
LHRIGTKAGLVTEINLGLVPLAFARNRRIRLALVGALQRLLRRQPLTCQHRPDRSQDQARAESPGDKFAHDVAGPEAKVKTVLHRILAMDPAKHLAFLRRGAPRGGRIRSESVAGFSGICRGIPGFHHASENYVLGSHDIACLARVCIDDS